MIKKFPDKEYLDEPNMISVNPGDTKEQAWHFTKAGDSTSPARYPVISKV